VKFGLELKRLREARGLTYGQLARKAGVSRAYLWQVEHGREAPLTVPRIVTVCAALRLPGEAPRLAALAVQWHLERGGLVVTATAIDALAAGLSVREAA